MSEYRRAKKSIEVSPGESVKILRELQELSQNALADLTGIPQSTISAIENDRVRLGVEQAKILARALSCRPDVIVFPGRGVTAGSAAS
ncbi:MAG: helix-turn-helix transcriptional regulator [Proteobacteria bacterium]|nr:helix-turn-helix transcriptional regulator [Pseudomonadota bacterium]